MSGRINYISGSLNKAKKIHRGRSRALPPKQLFSYLAPPRLTEEEVERFTEASLSETGSVAANLSTFGEDEEEKSRVKWNYTWAKDSEAKKGEANGDEERKNSTSPWFMKFAEQEKSTRSSRNKLVRQEKIVK